MSSSLDTCICSNLIPFIYGRTRFCQLRYISRFARANAEYAPSFMPSCRVHAELQSFMPSRMSMAEFYAEFFEIKVLLLVQLPGTIT